MTACPTTDPLSPVDSVSLRKRCLVTLETMPGQTVKITDLASRLQMNSPEVLVDLCRSMPEWLDLADDTVSLRAFPDWLNAERLRQAVGAEDSSLDLQIELSTGSTNQDVLDRLCQSQMRAEGQVEPGYIASLAETQLEGRGRRGRQWHAGIGNALLLSLGWRQKDQNPNLALIPLVMGLVVVEVLQQQLPTQVASEVSVKWPNDVYIGNAKLAGLLVESKPLPDGTGMAVVVGMGLNVRVEETSIPSPAQKTVSLHQLMDVLPDRNRLAAALLKGFMRELPQVLQHGFAPYESRWCERAYLNEKAVRLVQGEDELFGLARGVSPDGNLLVEVDGELRAFHSGEVSVRRRF